MSIPQPETTTTPIRKRVFAGVASTLFLGAIGSGVWEVLFRPGLSWIGGQLSSISNRFESQIYLTAALDPQPLPGLLLLLVLCVIPFLLGSYLFMRGFIETPLRRIVHGHLDKSLKGIDDKSRQERILRGRLWLVAGAGVIVCCLYGAMTLVGFTLQNESTKVWRIFQSNVEILSSVLPEQEVRLLHAKFRQMKNRKDFESLRRDMDAGAVKNKVNLNWYGA